MSVTLGEELLDGNASDMPPVGRVSVTFKKEIKAKRNVPEQLSLED